MKKIYALILFIACCNSINAQVDKTYFNYNDALKNPNLVYKLYLISNHLKSIPESIGNFKNLKKLDLEDNELTSLPESIGNLTDLTWLTLGFNQLESLPESFGKLTKLTTLKLFGNQFTSLPESIGNHTDLTGLFLGINQLRSLPESIGNLNNLIWLTLSDNQLTSLPESIGNLTNLENLYLSNNQLRSLPKSIGNLKNLKNLHLEGNSIDEYELARIKTLLPKCQIHHYISIDPQENKIYYSLKEALKTPDKVFKLNLNNKNLTTLRESISKFKNLKWLDLKNNKLTNLPDSISELTNLTWLNIKGNNFSPEEKEKIRILLPNIKDFHKDEDPWRYQYHKEGLKYCDSIKVSFIEIDSSDNKFNILFNVQKLYDNIYGFGNCGFILMDDSGNTIAIEQSTYFYGLSYSQNRILNIVENIKLPFTGTLHLYNDLLVGGRTHACSFSFKIPDN